MQDGLLRNRTDKDGKLNECLVLSKVLSKKYEEGFIWNSMEHYDTIWSALDKDGKTKGPSLQDGLFLHKLEQDGLNLTNSVGNLLLGVFRDSNRRFHILPIRNIIFFRPKR